MQITSEVYIKKFMMSNEFQDYLELGDKVLMVLPDEISVKDTSLCVGQTEAFLTPEGFKSIIFEEWTESEMDSGTNYIISKGNFPNKTQIRFCRRTRWRCQNDLRSIILPYNVNRENGRVSPKLLRYSKANITVHGWDYLPHYIPEVTLDIFLPNR